MRSVILLPVVAVLALVGCQSPVAEPSSDQSAAPSTTTEDTPDVPVAPAQPEFAPDLPAADNVEFFRSVIEETGAGSEAVEGAVVISALVEAGFDATSIEVTPDTSLIKLPADSVTVAVAFAGECLIGQYTDSWLVADVAAELAPGVCLVQQIESVN